MKTTSQIKKWGNSLAVRIPQRVAEELGLSDNTDIEITSNSKAIMIKASAPIQKLTLEALLEGVTPASVHGEFDWGSDVGAERWYED